MNTPQFSLGTIVITPGIDALLRKDVRNRACIDVFLARHQCGDWGDVGAEDKFENDLSVAEGFRVLSAFHLLDQKIWILTESDRSATTVLLPHEY